MITTDSVITPMGSNYYAVLPCDKATEKIEKLILSAKKNQDNISDEVKKVEKELVSLLKEARGQHV
jgi:prefoldin subunit 5